MARMNQKDKINMVLESYNFAHREFKDMHDEWLERLRAYKRVDTELEKRQKEGLASLFIPKIYSTMRMKAARITLALLARRPYVMGMPRSRGGQLSSEEDWANAQSSTYLLDYQTQEMIPFLRNTWQVVMNCLIYGTSPVQVGWRHDERLRTVRRVEYDRNGTRKGLGKPEQIKQILYDGPEHLVHDPFSVLPDPGAQHENDREFVLIQQYMTKRELKRLQDEGVFKNIGKLSDEPNNSRPEWYTEKKELEGFTASGTRPADVPGKRYEVLTMWTPERVYSLVDREVLVRDMDNPFWHGRIPIIIPRYNPLVGEVFGEGDVASLMDLQHEKNALRNSRLDQYNFAANPMWSVIRGANIAATDLRSRRGGVVYVNDHDDLRRLDLGSVNRDAYEENQLVDNDFHETSGVYPHMMGQPVTKRATATEMAQLNANADEPFQLAVRFLADEYLHPVLTMTHEVNQQFLAPQTTIHLLGLRGVNFILRTLDPENIVGDFDFVVRGATVDTIAEQQFKANQMIQLLAQLSNVPSVQQNIDKWVRRIMELSGVDGVDELAQQDPMALMQQMQQEQMQQQPEMAPQDPMMQSPMPQMPDPANMGMVGPEPGMLPPTEMGL